MVPSRELTCDKYVAQPSLGVENMLKDYLMVALTRAAEAEGRFLQMACPGTALWIESERSA